METINKNTDFEKKAKNKILTGILIACFFALIVLSSMEFSSGKMVNGIAESVFILPVAIGIILAFRKRYAPAASILVIAAYALATILSLIVNQSGAILVYRNCTYFFLALSMALTFSDNLKVTQILSAAMIIVQAVFCFVLLAPTGYSPINKIITLFIMSTILYVLISVLFFSYAALTKTLMATVNRQKAELSGELNRVSKIIQGASDNLEAMSNLSESVTEIRKLVTSSVDSMNTIDEHVKGIDKGADAAIHEAGSISVNIRNLNENILEMTGSQAETQKSVNSMVGTIRQVADSAADEHRILNSLSETSQNGTKQLHDLVENIRTATESIQAIYGKLEAINNIAVQTNLLAMNAAIEAAHAGTYGRGFAVVAGEIRKLADNSAHNSSDITNQLQQVTECITRVSEQGKMTSDSFSLIQEEIEQAVESFGQIKQSTDVLASGSEQVLRTLEELNERSRMIKTGGDNISSSQQQLHENQQNLKEAVVRLNAESHNIMEQNKYVLSALVEISEVSENGRIQAANLQELTTDRR